MDEVLRWHRRLGLLAVVAVVAACATPEAVKQRPEPEQSWSGRLLLKADTEPSTHFSAVFVLRGTPEAGHLALSTPLGTTLATASWRPGGAELRGAGPARAFASIDALTETLTGTRLPVATLFAWLQGTAATTDGWQADLSGLAAGRLLAQRHAPLPKAELRLVLDTPPMLQK